MPATVHATHHDYRHHGNLSAFQTGYVLMDAQDFSVQTPTFSHVVVTLTWRSTVPSDLGLRVFYPGQTCPLAEPSCIVTVAENLFSCSEYDTLPNPVREGSRTIAFVSEQPSFTVSVQSSFSALNVPYTLTIESSGSLDASGPRSRGYVDANGPLCRTIL